MVKHSFCPIQGCEVMTHPVELPKKLKRAISPRQPEILRAHRIRERPKLVDLLYRKGQFQECQILGSLIFRQ